MNMTGPKNSSDQRSNALLALATAAITLLVYLPSVKYGFVSLDDFRYVPNNPAIRHIDWPFLKLIFTTVIASNWHPLTIFSYALDYSLWGADPLGYHFENIIFHAVNTALVFLLTIRLFKVKGIEDSRALFAGTIASLLFGLHPVHVESVSWISERKDVLSGFFFILSILAYLEFASPSSGSSGKKALYYFASLLALVLAVLSKPMAVTLPVVLLLLDLYPLERLGKGVKVIAEKIPFFAVSLLSAILTLWAQSYGGAIKTFESFPLDKRIFLSVRGVVFYLYKMVLPINLAPIYLPPADTSLVSPFFLLCLAIVIAITVFSLVMAKRNGIYLSAWLYYVATLLPVLGIIQVGDQAAADRYTYLPSLGPFILVSIGAGLFSGRLSNRAVKIVVAASLAIASVLAVKTVAQEAVWKDSITLWTHEIKTEGEAPFAYNSRGLVYQEMNDQKKAISDFNRAIELDPKYAIAYNNRGYSYQLTKDYSTALKDYDKAIALDPKIPNPYNNRGLLHYELQEFQRAVEDFKRAAELDPKLVNAYINMGLAYTELQSFPEALKSFDAGLKASPMNPSIYLNRGFLYLTMGEYGKAASDFESSIKYEPDEPGAYWGLGLSYLRLGENSKGLENIKKAAEMGSTEAKDFLSRTPSPYK